MFSDCNATRSDTVCSNNPGIVHFDVVKAKSLKAVDDDLKQFYQAEVLVPSVVPPHLLIFPMPKTHADKMGTATEHLESSVSHPPPGDTETSYHATQRGEGEASIAEQEAENKSLQRRRGRKPALSPQPHARPA